MSVNRRRGEVEAVLDGKPHRLCLTLGALAELEDAFAAEDLGALVERFTGGRFSARDMIRIIGAGLRGAGEAIDDAGVAALHVEGGAAGYAGIVSRLLTETFGGNAATEPAQNP